MKFPRLLATLLGWLAGNPKRSRQISPADLDGRSELSPEGAYESIGVFSTRESTMLLDRFEKLRLRFQIGCDTSAGTTDINAVYCERTTIEVFMHRDDLEKAQEIILGWRNAIGAPSAYEIAVSNQSAKPNRAFSPRG